MAANAVSANNVRSENFGFNEIRNVPPSWPDWCIAGIVVEGAGNGQSNTSTPHADWPRPSPPVPKE